MDTSRTYVRHQDMWMPTVRDNTSCHIMHSSFPSLEEDYSINVDESTLLMTIPEIQEAMQKRNKERRTIVHAIRQDEYIQGVTIYEDGNLEFHIDQL